MTTFTATLCNADGSEAGCGRCVRPAGHPLGEGEMHQGPRGARDRFYLMERCPFCVELREEGPQLSAHVRDAHGGVPAGEGLWWGAGPEKQPPAGSINAPVYRGARLGRVEVEGVKREGEAHGGAVAVSVEQLGLFGGGA